MAGGDVPELPEVEIARRQLTRWLAGRRIEQVIVADPTAIRRSLGRRAARWDEGIERVSALAGQLAGEPARHGKRIGWTFQRGGVLLHLGMTGSFVRRGRDESPPHGRLGLLAGEIAVWFVDPRRFGAVIPVDVDALPAVLADGLGPDALDTPLAGPALKVRLDGRGPIKPALMDQARIAGLGNIQAAEALWQARIAPDRPGRSLSDAEWERIAAAIPEQLRRTLDADDGDELVYTNLGGANPFQVYGREGEPCPRCGSAITRVMLGGRATFHCGRCQPT